MTDKPDAADFRSHIATMKQQKWLGPARRWWLEFLFFHTDITNIVSILQSGTLLPRSKVERLYPNFTDSASPEIIEQTDERWKDYVRLYFRPRTPTLYDSEGFRPIERRVRGAHCPVPIYLLFDLEAIICRADSLFSNGNLRQTRTGKVAVYRTAADFCSLPFNLIYHDTWFRPEERDTIISRRHAEVVVPNQLSLEHLKRVWCRSPAERETLRYLLGESLWQKWQDKITERTDYSLFHRRWVYIDNVILDNSHIRFYCNPCYSARDAGPFRVDLEIHEVATERTYSWRDETYLFRNRIDINLVNLKYPEHYTVRLYIDNHLAYAGEHQNVTEIPF
jgi:hypothetical protein